MIPVVCVLLSINVAVAADVAFTSSMHLFVLLGVPAVGVVVVTVIVTVALVREYLWLRRPSRVMCDD